QRVDALALLDASLREPERAWARAGGPEQGAGVRRPVPGVGDADGFAEVSRDGVAAPGRDRPGPGAVAGRRPSAPRGSGGGSSEGQSDPALADSPSARPDA